MIWEYFGDIFAAHFYFIGVAGSRKKKISREIGKLKDFTLLDSSFWFDKLYKDQL